MATRFISRREVEVLLKVEREFLLALENEEIVVCEQEDCYSPTMLERIRVCYTLHHDLDVNFAGLDVALNLLETIDSERRQFRSALDWLQGQLCLQRKDGR
jgi:hypothetical protein